MTDDKNTTKPTPASLGSVDALSVLQKLIDGVRGMTYGDPDDPASVEASTIVRWAVDEIEQLRGSIEWYKDMLREAEEKMCRDRLTDAERDLLMRLGPSPDPVASYRAILSPEERKTAHGLLERLK